MQVAVYIATRKPLAWVFGCHLHNLALPLCPVGRAAAPH